MIFLEAENQIIRETLEKRITAEKFELCDVSGADFDGATFRLVTVDDKKSELLVSMKLNCDEQLKKYGMDDVVKKAYGSWVAPTQEGFSVTIKVDLEAASLDEKLKEEYLTKVPLIKRYLMMSPFATAFDKFAASENFEPITIPYRPEENIYILTFEKSLTVMFSIKFSDPDDVVLARIFLSEFKDARRDRALGNAPSVNFTHAAKPLELKNIKSSEPDDPKGLSEFGFVSLTLFTSHMNEKNREGTIDKLLTFRNYLHYHLKCTKAYMHIRMRDRFAKLLENLEASKDNSGIVKERKTATGRRFVEK
ncbi:actin-related protein 2/3 complex subunit 2 [Acrasis kona]|uniref:Arp2/3 complex 34 kDa subunit n=1 Tax=Acrasis kona TaxID=1008807 RepID=A0AAW2Z9S2_9EUKA